MNSSPALNGKQLAEVNFNAFDAWAASKSDADFRDMVSRGVLSRKEIAIECGFAKSALDQNPRIKKALLALEDKLRSRGVLPALAPKVDAEDGVLVREPGKAKGAQDAERLRRMEQENAALKAEVSELRRQLEKHATLQEALALTGRLPR